MSLRIEELVEQELQRILKLDPSQTTNAEYLRRQLRAALDYITTNGFPTDTPQKAQRQPTPSREKSPRELKEEARARELVARLTDPTLDKQTVVDGYNHLLRQLARIGSEDNQAVVITQANVSTAQQVFSSIFSDSLDQRATLPISRQIQRTTLSAREIITIARQYELAGEPFTIIREFTRLEGFPPATYIGDGLVTMRNAFKSRFVTAGLIKENIPGRR